MMIGDRVFTSNDFMCAIPYEPVESDTLAVGDWPVDYGTCAGTS